MTSRTNLAQATDAAARATRLAAEAERCISNGDIRSRLADLTRVGTLWADIANAQAAIARATTEETTNG